MIGVISNDSGDVAPLASVAEKSVTLIVDHPVAGLTDVALSYYLVQQAALVSLVGNADMPQFFLHEVVYPLGFCHFKPFRGQSNLL